MRLPNLLAYNCYNCSQYSLTIFCYFYSIYYYFSSLFFILFNWIFSFLILVSLARGLSIFFTLSKNQFLVLLIISIKKKITILFSFYLSDLLYLLLSVDFRFCLFFFLIPLCTGLGYLFETLLVCFKDTESI